MTQVCVAVEDDGRGLPEADQRPARFGLLGLRERVLALGGEFRAERRPQGGSRIEARLTLPS
jgi:signal transduction histidine kinase